MVTTLEDGTVVIRVRSKDTCNNYQCKGNKLVVTGMKEVGKQHFEVLTHCDLCGRIYAFKRRHRSVEK